MAEKYLQSLNLDIEVLSCGIAAFEGAEISALTKKVLKKFGISIPFHTIKQVSHDMVEWADIIFVMERYQEERLIALFPEVGGKIYLLGEYANLEEGEILDPYGGSIEAYESCFLKIKECIDRIKW